MMSTMELVERVRRRLAEQDSACTIVGPAPETEISAAEVALGCIFPPSYRSFLETVGGIRIPAHLGVVHDFAGTGDVVQRTLAARAEKPLFQHLLIVGMGAGSQEWFCLDTSRETSTGEYPVMLYDARDRALDQQFYDDFGQMLNEVLGFVADNLEQPLD